MADRVVTLTKAVPIYAGDEVQGRCIDITEPGTDFTGPNVVAEATVFFQQQAALVHEALTASLPGGTLSNLFALMAADRASIFRVLDPAARIHEQVPARRPDDDVVDAFIHEHWCTAVHPCPADVEELNARIKAALAIHKPCHTAVTEPWVCGRHSDPEHDGYYRLPAVCMDCVDGDENAVLYPCPTAQALGVTTWLAPLADAKAVATDG